ncbi:MAG: hypothetical protein LBH01_01280 [Verrucomicrobiales bacterium]|nr:hypothetical protein [Verrucomicrobiales bacterium]
MNRSTLYRILAISVFALACFVSRFKYLSSYLYHGQFYFSDPDCYTRLYRVKRLLAEGLLFQGWHPFENYPFGTQVHTTAPLDWLLGLLALCCKPFTVNAIDWAGVLIGPVLAALTAIILFHLVQDFKPRWAKWPLLLTYLFSPMLIWATSVARPDHQNLIVSALVIAFALEFSRWEKPQRHLWAGIVWGIAIWTSLLEPLFFLSVIVIVNLVWRRREDWRFYLPIMLIVGISTLLEGFRWDAYHKLSEPLIANWLGTIGELRSILDINFDGKHSGWSYLVQILIDLFFRYGMAIYLLPLILLCTRKAKWWKDSVLVINLLCTILAFVLYLTQQRWSYFFAAAGMFSLFAFLPEQLKLRYKVLLLILQFFPMLCQHVEEFEQLATQKNPPLTVSVREAALQIRQSGVKGGILAPWWLSPALLYYSDQPIVASSSHESIDGIIDSAKFYSTRDFREAYGILDNRKVAWVAVYRPELLYTNSVQILTGEPFEKIQFPDSDRSRVVLRRLFEDIAVPRQFSVAYVSPNFIFYRYNPQAEK